MSSKSSKAFIRSARLTFLIGLGCSWLFLFTLLFFSRAQPWNVHEYCCVKPWQIYVIPYSVILITGTFFFSRSTRRFSTIHCFYTWLNLAALMWLFRVSRDTLGSSLLACTIATAVAVVCAFYLCIHCANKNSLNVIFFNQIAAFLLLFLGFLFPIRLHALFVINQKLPYNDSIINSLRGQSNDHFCYPRKGSPLYAKNNSTLIIVLDSFPTDGLYYRITGYRSKVHSYLRRTSTTYVVGKTPVASTPFSLGYLLAGVPPNNSCFYPLTNNLNFAFGSYAFSSSNSICNPERRVLQRKFMALVRSPFMLAAGTNILKSYSFDLNRERRMCSLLNTSLLPHLMEWAQSPANSYPSTPIIHEMHFHDYYTKDVKAYKTVDESYAYAIAYLTNLVRSRKSSFNSLLVLSDHGPRTGFFKTYAPQEPIVETGGKFDDHFSMFYAIINLTNNSGNHPIANNPSCRYYLLDQFARLRELTTPVSCLK
jgi:hypothetical protein